MNIRLENLQSDGQLTSLIAGIFIIVPLLLYVVYQRLFSPLASIPGPLWASLSRWWLAYRAWRGGTHILMPNLHKQYGPVVRIAPDEV